MKEDLKPVVSEKSSGALSGLNQYIFYVDPELNKIDISRLVAKKFSVKVEDVRTMVVKGKLKRKGRHLVKGSNRKKAIVTLSQGFEISEYKELF
jgi:large subunit ribosomal protein L23